MTHQMNRSSSPTLGKIAQLWVLSLVMGQIKYHPELIASRWLLAGGNGSLRIKLVLNAGRKARLAA